MGALGKASAIQTETVMFLGRTDPFDYDAGEINGKRFGAGTSFRVVVGFEALNFEELKVKGADFDRVWSQLQHIVSRGVELEIDFRPSSGNGTNKRAAELVDVRVLATAGK